MHGKKCQGRGALAPSEREKKFFLDKFAAVFYM
jgi:hypothetical protein